jgi:hypothetical protein
MLDARSAMTDNAAVLVLDLEYAIFRKMRAGLACFAGAPFVVIFLAVDEVPASPIQIIFQAQTVLNLRTESPAVREPLIMRIPCPTKLHFEVKNFVREGRQTRLRPPGNGR